MTIMTNNYTKKDYFNMITTVISESEAPNKDELMEFVGHEIELLNRRSEKAKTASKSESKEHAANRKVKEEIIEVLREFDEPVSATTIAEKTLYTTQKVAALLRYLVDENRVVKTVDKKKTYYSVNC